MDRAGGYGSPKIWRVLRRQCEGCGKHRIARLMRREGLRGHSRYQALEAAEVRKASG
ncbi:MAG: transposase [Nitrospiraceae bacterium]|nr:transposase [Nitrospira sp.]MCB9775534.1 transposase [Nitrospiraceae bacterium]